MLQPETYPELVGKTLVLDAEPFIQMVDDDEPWAEGLFFTVCLGAAVGFAQFVGGLLTTASLPPANAILETLLHGWQQLGISLGADPVLTEELLRQLWTNVTLSNGLDGGWLRLHVLITTPVLLIALWFLYGSLAHLIARWQSGSGTFDETLGATALMTAPAALLLLTAVPLVQVSPWLIATWMLLIVYRAVEVAHDLPWQRAAIAAVVPVLLVFVLGVALLLSALALALGGVA